VHRNVSNAVGAALLALSSVFVSGVTAQEERADVAWSSSDPVERYVTARAAAEVCYGRPLTESESAAFFMSLAYRDAKHRSAQRLERDTRELLTAYRASAETIGCDDANVAAALRDWTLRVTLFTGIDLVGPVGAEEDTAAAEPEIAATGSIE